jgi:hypothetical protein
MPRLSVLLLEDTVQLQDSLEALIPFIAAKQMGLMINYKIKYMELSNSPTRENYIIINNHNIKKIMEFKYLGSLISNNNNSITVKINHRILLGNRCYYGLRNLL